MWKKTELELKRLNTKSKQTSSNDNTPFEEDEDIAGPSNVLSHIVEGDEDTALIVPSNVLSPIVEGNEDTAIAGQSNIPSPFKRYIFCHSDDKKKPQKKKSKEIIPAIVPGELGQLYFQKKMDKKNEMERLKQERAAKR